jgi:hypothetical protein
MVHSISRHFISPLRRAGIGAGGKTFFLIEAADYLSKK